MEHYKCHKVYGNVKRSKWVGDTVNFFRHQTKTTFMYSANHTSLDVADLREALLHPNPEAPLTKIV